MISRRSIAGMILGSLLPLAPALAGAQDNPWRVPPAGAPAYAPTWQGNGGSGGWREPSYAATWPGERPSPPAQCQGDARWPAAEAAQAATGQRRIGETGGLNAVTALGASAITTGTNRDWAQGTRTAPGYGLPPAPAAPPLILGEFPPLDEDVTQQPAPPPRGVAARHGADNYPARSYTAPSYAAPAYAPPDYEPRGRYEAPRGARREAPPAWNSYPPPAPTGPSTLGGGWGPGTGVYGSYAYPYASGVPAAYGWF